MAFEDIVVTDGSAVLIDLGDGAPNAAIEQSSITISRVRSLPWNPRRWWRGPLGDGDEALSSSSSEADAPVADDVKELLVSRPSWPRRCRAAMLQYWQTYYQKMQHL